MRPSPSSKDSAKEHQISIADELAQIFVIRRFVSPSGPYIPRLKPRGFLALSPCTSMVRRLSQRFVAVHVQQDGTLKMVRSRAPARRFACPRERGPQSAHLGWHLA
jgi:hypothetical protein